MAIVEEKKEPKFIDPLAFSIGGSAVEMDTEADAYERVAPPPMGRYDLHVTESERCWEERETETGDKYVVANLECKIVNAADPDVNGQMVFARVSTFMGRGKKISTMAYVLLKMGYPKEKLTGALTTEELVQKFHKFIIKQDRVVKDCLLDWQGYSPAQKAVIYNKMADFPKGKDGQYLHIVEYRKAGQPSEEIVARLKLKDWGGSGGGATAPAKAPAAAPKVVKRAAVVEEDEEATPASSAPAPKTGKKPPAPSAAEVSALLDGDDD